MENRATVTSDTIDDNPANNSVVESTQVIAPIPRANLEVTQSDTVDPVAPGAEVSYIVTGDKSHGPDTAMDVVVSDAFPLGIPRAATLGCAEDPGGLPACSLGNIAPGAAKAFTLTVLVGDETSGILTNTATAVSETDDPDPSDNVAAESTTVLAEGPEADLGRHQER